MIYIDKLTVSPNPVDEKKEFIITIKIHEEYENAKKYVNQYPHRYGKKNLPENLQEGECK